MDGALLRRYAHHIRRSENLTPARGAGHGQIANFPALNFRCVIAKNVSVITTFLNGVRFDVDEDDFDTALCLTSVWFLYLVDTCTRCVSTPYLSEARVRVVLGVLQNEYRSQDATTRNLIHEQIHDAFVYEDACGNKQVILESSKSMQFLRDKQFSADTLQEYVFAPLFPCAVREIVDCMVALEE